MSRYLIVLSAAFLVASVIGCEHSKLQKEMLGDSTWESSAGAEDVTVNERKPSADDEWEKENAPMEGEESDPQSSVGQPYPRVSTGVITRQDLVPVLDGGLGRYLQNVETEPAFHKGAFVGFRIVSFFPGELDYASIDLKPGDTVTEVNGRSIERPEQAVAIWEELRTAENLVVKYRRGDQERSLRFRIVDLS